MIDSLAQRVVKTFGLTEDQRTSALERERDVIVTAGAGSGKTRTLVARYTSLLADGLSPRKVVAITFTEKAAREMRSRLRGALNDLLKNAESKEEHGLWAAMGSQMDAARIGTIHSLCAEILRSHPAEAGIDPRFEVLDEGLAATLKKQLVDEALTQMVAVPGYKPLFQVLGTRGVQELLTILLNRRLEAQEIFTKHVDGDAIVRDRIESILKSSVIVDIISELRAFKPNELLDDAGDKLAEMVTDLLGLWQQAEAALVEGDITACASTLFQVRREKLKKGVGRKTSRAKDAIAALQEAYDETLNPLIGGKDSKDSPPNVEAEALFKTILPLIETGSAYLQRLYQAELSRRHALDFDDLEYGAVQLLKREDIRAYWRNEVQALLVDEFQDTNPRQREIVEALTGNAGRLFVVGDARQSIYRFRRADVTVFREVQEQARKNGSLVLDLDTTYRAHAPLLAATGDLLVSIMGDKGDPARPYYVPFTPLKAYRKTQPENISDPHIEFIFGAGNDADAARLIAARALAQRLLALKEKKQIHNWDDVALLFRASTGYAFYEDVFEEAGIPFVTVSGRGFYDRPEIRDVLNLLRALADPADDLALAGLLRSPAFGLSDSALYQLRLQGKTSVPYWTALQGDISFLSEPNQARGKRAAEIVRGLLPQVDREPVADLLKSLVDAVDYRAILAADDERGSNGRLWRNLDKLISDAQTSGYVNVRDFLEYLSTLNDAGAREGEATADAQGAVRLMTIHKSKGLEFPIVVLADGARTTRSQSDPVYLLPEMGLSLKLDHPPLLYRLSKQLDDAQSEAESGRLLYVALTRAKDKLIISGHMTTSRNIATSGWMKGLCEALGIDLDKLATEAGTFSQYRTASNHPVLAWCIPAQDTPPRSAPRHESVKPEESNAPSLYHPLMETKPVTVEEDETQLSRIWRVTEATLHVPPSIIGQMTHKVLELWLAVDSPRLLPLLESLALDAGLATQAQRVEAVRRVRELIERLCAHPLRAEIDSAAERHHEVPYSRMAGEFSETGYIDLLYRSSEGWQVVDFKTDSIRSARERDELIGLYRRQMSRYIGAVKALLGQPAQVRICFLDDNGSVNVVGL